MAIVNGDDKDNTLTATDNADTINGKGGDDVLIGYRGADKLFGGDGDDVLNGGYGSNTLNGGSGFDYADLRYDDEGVRADLSRGTIIAFNQADTLNSVEGILTGSGDDTVAGGGGGDAAFLFGGDDRFSGGGGADRASGGAGDDRLDGGGGADTLNAAGGDDVISGGSGFDTLDYYFASGISGDVNGAAVSVNMKSGKATIGGETDRFSGVEQVWTGSGDDRLRGDDGDNSFYSAGGDDRLTGGGGQDRFLFDDRDGTDRITDFGDTADRIDLTSIRGINDVSDIDIRQTGDDVSIDYGSGTIVLDDIAVSDIGSADFLF